MEPLMHGYSLVLLGGMGVKKLLATSQLLNAPFFSMFGVVTFDLVTEHGAQSSSTITLPPSWTL